MTREGTNDKSIHALRSTETSSALGPMAQLVTNIAETQTLLRGAPGPFHYGLLPEHQRARLETILHGIERGRDMRDVRITHIPNDEDGRDIAALFVGTILQKPENSYHRESVLEHSTALLSMLADVQQRSVENSQGNPEYKGLAHVLDVTAAANIIPGHDIGEGWPGGDVPRRLDVYTDLRSSFQKGEMRFVEDVVLPGFDNDQQRAWFTNHYLRYEAKSPSDLEAQLVNLLDKIQSQLFIEERDIPMSFDVRMRGIAAGLEAQNLIVTQLESASPEAANELRDYVQSLLARIDPEVVMEAQRLVNGERKEGIIVDLESYRRRKIAQEQTIQAPYEIERQWIPSKQLTQETLRGYTPTEITQWHFVIDGREIRLRQEGDRFFLTTLGENNIYRAPIELEITSAEGEDLLAESRIGQPIQKTRYQVGLSHGAPIFYDVYHGHLEGLTMYEMKFKTQQEADAFDPQGWLGDEVTQEMSFESMQLSRQGIPARRVNTTV